MSTQNTDSVADMLLAALTTDGGHHKQWYLERAMRAISGDAYVDSAKDELQWEDGIAP